MIGELSGWLPAICRRRSQADEEPTRRIGRIILITLVVAAFATLASSARGGSDPRVCNAPGGDFPLPARQCAHRAAYAYFEGYLVRRMQIHDGIVPAVVTCKTAGSIFRYSCKFNGGWLRGLAIVSLGQSPTWKRTLTFREFVCLVKRPGCPQ